MPKVNFKLSEYETKQVFYTSKDGTRVPLFITYKKGLKLNGKNPVYLYALVNIHHHDLIHRRTVVGQQIDLVADGGDGRVGVVHVGDHLRKLRVAVFQVADIEDVARAAARLIEELHRLLVVDRRTEEVHRLGGILEEELVLLLLRAEAVEVDLVGGVLARIGVALGFVIGAIAFYVKATGKWYFYKNNGLQNQSVLYEMDGLGQEKNARVFLDPNQLSTDGTVALGNISFSHDGKYLAYAISRSGSDWSEFYVMDTKTLEVLGVG